MGLIAVHHPSGVATRDCPHEDALRRETGKPGLPGLPGRWVVLRTRIEGQAGGFVAPPRPQEGIGRPVPDPLDWWTPRQYPKDTHPVGVGRV